MRKSLTLAIVICVASPLTFAQGRETTAASASPAVSGTSQGQSQSADAVDHGKKSKSAFGQAMADLARALRDAKSKDAQVAQRTVSPEAANASIDAGAATPADAHASDRVAVQSESDVPR